MAFTFGDRGPGSSLGLEAVGQVLRRVAIAFALLVSAASVYTLHRLADDHQTEADAATVRGGAYTCAGVQFADFPPLPS